MKKIPTLFKRDFEKHGEIYDEYSDGTDWVVAGEGIATRKYDGQAVLIRDHKMYKRYELRPGKTAPADFEQVDYDETTEKAVGWVQVGNGSEDKWFREAIQSGDPDKVDLRDGTYELVGPKIQGNPEKYAGHILVAHDNASVFTNVPVEFDALKRWLTDKDIEGIVWHHPDGRMVKIKKKDFRIKR